MSPFAWSLLEAVAACGNLAYTVLMLYERRIGWLFGIAASALGIALFLHQQVFAQVALNTIYVGMGAYGWWSWGRGQGAELPIVRRGGRFHAVVIAAGLVGTLVLALALRLVPGAQHVALDGFATAFSLLATWMLARKVLENWAYWIVADAVAIALYAMLDLWWYVGLYAIYVGLSTSALRRWHRQWRAAQGP
ncbi:MAG TPA: nicotinamide riboside transporter PnuC [Flavobacteriales bacterium]|nr:nicotinamide riboside transporter PnuC [Flavobacteriales bacterium]HMR29102.1 nicotinamide riboside transporter PnuC [Flavobacteriales bacterium]